MNRRIEHAGPAYVIAGNVDTDTIIKSRHCADPDPRILAAHCLEELAHPVDFAANRPWPIIVCTGSFGIGSARIQAPLALHGAGVRVVLASHFSPIFFENCLNGALLLPLACEVEKLFRRWPRTGEVYTVRIDTREVCLRGEDCDARFACPLPAWALEQRPWMDLLSDQAQAAGGLEALRKTGLQL